MVLLTEPELTSLALKFLLLLASGTFPLNVRWFARSWIQCRCIGWFGHAHDVVGDAIGFLLVLVTRPVDSQLRLERGMRCDKMRRTAWLPPNFCSPHGLLPAMKADRSEAERGSGITAVRDALACFLGSVVGACSITSLSQT